MLCTEKKKKKNTKYTTEKVDGSGEGGGSHKKLLTPSNRDEWRAHGLRVHVTCQKP